MILRVCYQKALLAFLLGLKVCTCVFTQSFIPPITSTQPVTDTIFGKVVVDEFRWLEDMSSKQVKDWLQAQTNFSASLLDKIPGRDALLEEYKKLDQL